MCGVGEDRAHSASRSSREPELTRGSRLGSGGGNRMIVPVVSRVAGRYNSRNTIPESGISGRRKLAGSRVIRPLER